MKTFKTENGEWVYRPSGFADGTHHTRQISVTVFESGRPAITSVHTTIDELSEAVQIARDLVVEGSLALNEIALAESLAGEADE